MENIVKLTLYDDVSTTVFINVEKTKLLKYHYFRDINEFSEIGNELTIKVDNPIDFSKAILNTGIIELANSMNLLGSENILEFVKSTRGKTKLELIEYYSNVDPVIWYELLITVTKNTEILDKTFNSTNLLHYIINTNNPHRYKFYVSVLKNIEYNELLSDYYKILLGHSNKILDKLKITTDKKLINFFFGYTVETGNLSELYDIFENCKLMLYNLIVFCANHTKNNIKFPAEKFLHPNFIQNFGGKLRCATESEFEYDNFYNLITLQYKQINLPYDCGTPLSIIDVNSGNYYVIIFDNGVSLASINTDTDLFDITSISNNDVQKYCILSKDKFLVFSPKGECTLIKTCDRNNEYFEEYPIDFNVDINYKTTNFYKNYFAKNGIVYELKLKNLSNLYYEQVYNLNLDIKYTRILNCVFHKFGADIENLENAMHNLGLI